MIVGCGGVPAPLGYKGFPRSICTSINHVVCHGIPGDRKLADGEIVNIDVTVVLDGWHGDSSRMYLVGDKVPVKARRLVEVTYDCLMRGIEVIRPGVRLGAIGHAIQEYAEGQRFSVVIGRHTSELQSLMRSSYAVFSLKKKKKKINRQLRFTNDVAS